MIKHYEKKIDTLGLNNEAKRIVKNLEKRNVSIVRIEWRERDKEF